MTRRGMRGGRSEWETLSKVSQDAQVALYAELAAGGADTLPPAQKAALERLEAARRAPRARAVQHELREAEHLAVEAYRRWWWRGFTALEHRSAHAREADQRAHQGVQAGLPDYLLLVPCDYPGRGDARPARTSVRAALELKAPAHRPKREVSPRWWLAECDGKTHYGLRPEQRHWLRTMAGAGFETMVAFSATDALAWLDAQAGPRPEVMPW